MMPFRSLLPLAALLLAGCVGPALDAPSLASRDYEKQPVPVPDQPSEPASTLDPALAGRLKALLDRAQAAHASFGTAQAKAGAMIARAATAPGGSEPWTAAQQELSALDAGRGPLQGIAAEIDALRGDPANATPANREAIDAEAAEVQALADQESAAIAALSSKLR